VDKVESEDEDEKKLSDKKEQSKTTTVLVTFYDKKKEVHKVPSTRLAMSEDGKYLAIGASDGSVSVVEVEKLKEVKKVSCHDLPVTGLGFAPQHLTKEKGKENNFKTLSVY
jgi:WD40 repeat protein